MALRLRRGTNTERQTVTFSEGELIYVTDYDSAGVSPLWIGDGSTVGGVEVETGGTPTLALNDLTDVNAFAIENNVLVYQGSQWTSVDPSTLGISGTGIVEGQEYNISINGSVIGGDSSIIVDSTTQVVTANLFVGSGAGLTDINLGDLEDVFTANLQIDDVLAYNGTGWVPTSKVGIVDGQEYNISINGSVIGSDSSIIVDHITQVVTANLFVGSGAGLTDINLVDLDDVFAFGAVANDVLTYNGTGWVPAPSQGIELGQTYDINIEGNVLGADSSIIVNYFTGVITGDLTGNVTGNVVGNVVGNVEGNVVGNVTGDLNGSVYTDNSTLVIDGILGSVYPNRIYTNTFLRITDDTPATTNTIQMESQDQFTALQLIRKSDTDISGSNLRYGQVRFGREDSGGLVNTAIISANRDFIWFAHTSSGSLVDADIVAISNQKFGIGTVTPAATLDVRGNAIIAGDLTAAAFKGTFVADDSSIILDGTTGSLITANVDVIGSVAGTPSVGGGDLPNVNQWLLVTVNGATRYIPLYA
jgi:hypothetical protein